MRRFKRKYSKAKTRNTSGLEIERQYVIQYGLRNKKELNRIKASVARIRRCIRSYSFNTPIIQSLLTSLIKLGVLDEKEAEVQNYENLTITAFLERRLQTLISKKYHISLQKSRQLICHGHVKLENKYKKFPGYLIRSENEKHIIVNRNLKLIQKE